MNDKGLTPGRNMNSCLCYKTQISSVADKVCCPVGASHLYWTWADLFSYSFVTAAPRLALGPTLLIGAATQRVAL
jgi:hypothetical protein